MSTTKKPSGKGRQRAESNVRNSSSNEGTDHQGAQTTVAAPESTEMFRAIFDCATEGILLADNNTKKFYMGNDMGGFGAGQGSNV